MATNWTVTGLTLATLLAFGICYALVVRWMSRNHVEGQTAYLVVFGVMVTVLASGILIGFQSAAIIFACFSASGFPMVIEYVLRVSDERKRDHEGAQEIARSLFNE